MKVGIKGVAEQPVTEHDAFIARALKSANIPALMMSIVHLTGSDAILHSGLKLGMVSPLDMDGGLAEADKERVRQLALEALSAYRDGKPLPPEPSHETLLKMIGFIAGEAVSEDYVAMATNELGLDGADQAFHWSGDRRPAAAEGFHVLIVGAGMSGLLQGIRLAEAGIPFTIIEKNADVGGTWLENRYPGCRVDSSNHFYSYSFEPNNDWPEHFSQRKELHAYFRACAERYDLHGHIRFQTEVEEARFDEAEGLWKVTLRKADGGRETVCVNALVSAVGQLNRPNVPEFKGRERFKGPLFHSAQWEEHHDLAGKRVAVIGAGATAFQLIPELARTASHLVCLQRQPSWMFPCPTYHDQVDEGKKWLLKHVPYYQRWYRFILFWSAGDGLLEGLKIDPAWDGGGRSINAINEMMRGFLTEAMVGQLGERPDLVEKVVPTYPPFGKRMLLDNGHYLRALTRPNVEVVAEGVRELVEGGLIDTAGRLHEVDAIVLCTGFQANKFLWPMKVVGRGGAVLSEVWGDTPRAYLGVTVPDFPNLFILYGPGTNLAHGGSIIFHSECQVRYVMGCLKALLENGGRVMDVRRETYEAFVQKLETTLAGMVWSHPAVRNWYKNQRGVVVNTSPWRLLDYWSWTREPKLADYELA
jgi:4-hydroxyacetophenone monooxygenase